MLAELVVDEDAIRRVAVQGVQQHLGPVHPQPGTPFAPPPTHTLTPARWLPPCFPCPAGPELGVELSDVIAKAKVEGIVNGMDVEEWNPALVRHYQCQPASQEPPTCGLCMVHSSRSSSRCSCFVTRGDTGVVWCAVPTEPAQRLQAAAVSGPAVGLHCCYLPVLPAGLCCQAVC